MTTEEAVITNCGRQSSQIRATAMAVSMVEATPTRGAVVTDHGSWQGGVDDRGHSHKLEAWKLFGDSWRQVGESWRPLGDRGRQFGDY